MFNFFPFSLAIFDFCAWTEIFHFVWKRILCLAFCFQSLSHFNSFPLFSPLDFGFLFSRFFFHHFYIQFFRFIFFFRKKQRCLVERHNEFCAEYWQLVIVSSILNIFPNLQPSLSFFQFASFACFTLSDMKHGCVTAVYALEVRMYHLNFISLLKTANERTKNDEHRLFSSPFWCVAWKINKYKKYNKRTLPCSVDR